MPASDKPSEIAAQWVVRIDAGKLHPDEKRELESWLEADPRHRGAFVRARAQWLDLDRFAALRGPSNADGAQLSQWSSNDTGADTSGRPPLSRRQLLAASVAAVAALGGGLSWIVLRESRVRYSTGIGEVRRIPLADGSTIILNTNSEIGVELATRRRDIQLIRGEALFEVARDKARPFVVRASNTAVKAVGTAFAVRLESTGVNIIVTEGVVEVSDRSTDSDSGVAPVAEAPLRARRIKANERAVIAHAQPTEIEEIAAQEAHRQLAWCEGMVSFNGQSLQTAVDEINRHNLRQIVIDDPVLARRPVVGVFRATDIDGFSAAAAAALNAHPVVDGDAIRLEPLPSQ